MKYVHVVIVGSSLATNYAGKGERAVEEELGKMNAAQLARYHKALHEFLRRSGPAASAEMSAMRPFLESGEISLAYLLHTDTPSSTCCAKALGMFLEEKGVESKLVEVKGFAGGPEKFHIGLSNLAREISHILASHEMVRICATGGYKPESSIASILGFIAGAPVYYAHVTFGRPVQLPSLPIDWKYEIKKHKRAIKEMLDRGRVPQREFVEKFGHEAADDLAQMGLLEKRDGDYVLIDLGRTLLEAIPSVTRRRRRVWV